VTSELDRLQLALPKRYTLLRELDRGGMSRVYLAREEMPDREVAIKVFDEKLSAQLGRERFVREVELTSQLGHPYIVPIHAAGDAEGALYYVMPFVRGESLRDRLEREGRLPIEDALRITEQVAGALTHAHEKGVVHRDIKPANILFHGGHAVVADFGIARALRVAETKGTLTHAGTALGTPDYMSPEQISGEEDVNERTDLYALACVLYEMLGGQPPFHSRTRQATLARHLADTMPSLRGLRDAIPKHVEDAIRRALSKAPVDRFASVEEFVQALRNPAPAPTGRAASGVQGGHRSYPSWATPWRLAGIAVLVAAIGLAWNAWLVEEPTPAIAGSRQRVAVAVLPPENRTGDPTLEVKALSLAEEVTAQLTREPELAPIGPNTVQWYQQLGLSPALLMDSLGVDALLTGTLELRNGLLMTRVWETDRDQDQSTPLTFEPIPVTAVDSLLTSYAREIVERFMRRHGLDESFTATLPEYGSGRDAWLQGDALLALRTAEGVRGALARFQEAIRLEPTLALAYAGLSSAYALSLTYRYDLGEGPYEVAAKAFAAADSAILLDSALSDGYAARGYVNVLLEMDIDGAEADFRRAGALAPNDASQLSWSARVLAARGSVDEALDSARRARDLDDREAGRHMAVAPLALQGGYYDEALSAAQAALRIQPDLSRAVWREALALALSGREEECLSLQLGAYELVRAVCMRRAGREDLATQMVSDAEVALEEGRVVNPGYLNDLAADILATYYGDLGDAANAARWLTKAFEISPVGVDGYLLRSELFALVADDPEFASALTDARNDAKNRVLQPSEPM
jgi:tetratricopeptide (TPR) repeat protein